MRATLLGLLLAGTACAASTGPCDEADAATGAWRYAGAQDAPAEASLAGTLALTGGCGSISGQLDLVEVDRLGHGRRIAGPISGRRVDATSLRFDVLIDGVLRQHLARFEGDSLTGTWLALGDGAAQAWTGTFTGKRGGTP